MSSYCLNRCPLILLPPWAYAFVFTTKTFYYPWRSCCTRSGSKLHVHDKKSVHPEQCSWEGCSLGSPSIAAKQAPYAGCNLLLQNCITMNATQITSCVAVIHGWLALSIRHVHCFSVHVHSNFVPSLPSPLQYFLGFTSSGRREQMTRT